MQTLQSEKPGRADPARRSPRGEAARAAAGAGGELTAAQRRAIQRLASGQSATDAAAAAGVHRQTVHRWLRDDPAFRAAFHAWQAAAADHARARLLALADAAVTTVAAAVAAGDTRTALAVLKGQGLLAPPTPGPTDPDHVAREQLTAAARAEAKLADAEATACPDLYVPAKFRAYQAARRPRPALPPPEPPADPLPADLDPNAADLRALDAAGGPTAADLAAFNAGLVIDPADGVR